MPTIITRKPIKLGIRGKNETDRFFEVKQVLKFAANKRVRGNPNAQGFRRNSYRLERVKLFTSSKLFEEFFHWFNSVRVRYCEQLKRRDIHFAKAIGIKKCTLKTYRLWNTNSGGFFPSDELIKRVQEVERQLLAEVVITKEDYRIKAGKRTYKINKSLLVKPINNVNP